MKEAISREVSIHVGGIQTPEYKEMISREYSVFVGDEPTPPLREAVSREVSIVVTTPEPPAGLANLRVETNPTGEITTLHWGGYNEWAERDVARYAVYMATRPFTNVTGMTPYAFVPAESFETTLTGLAPWVDRFFAVVPVDAAGNFVPTVRYAAAYPLARETVSREFSIYVGAEDKAFREVISREVSVVVSTPEPPAAIARLVVNGDVTGRSAHLSWESYNEWAERDVTRYDIYVAPHAFTHVTGLSPFASVRAETQTIDLTGLPEGEDHFFAVVPVDVTGAFVADVIYAAAYPIARETVSREMSIFVGAEERPFREVVSREVSVVVPTPDIPAPVTGLESGFSAVGSRSVFRAIQLDWSTYNEQAQRDVVRYLVFAGPAFYDDVSGLNPYAVLPAETMHWTATGFDPLGIYYLSVVAEDILGQRNTWVRSVSAQASIDVVREVQNLAVSCGTNWLGLSWQPPAGADPSQNELLAFYRLYVAGANEPMVISRTNVAYRLEGLEPARGYPLRLTTVDNQGRESLGASLLAATLLPQPPAQAARGFDGMVRVSWEHVEPNELLWKYAVYVSPTPFASTAGMTPVAITRNRRFDVTGLANGTEYYFAVTSINIARGESPDVLNVVATPVPRTGEFADLALVEASSPAVAYPGGSGTFRWRVRNAGLASPTHVDGSPVSGWQDRVVLSINEVFGDADDVVVADVPHTGGLPPGGEYVMERSLTVPRMAPGRYHVFITTDAPGEVDENLDVAENIALVSGELELAMSLPPGDRIVYELTTLYVTNTFAASPPPGAKLSWRLSGNPPGMVVDTTTGVVAWTSTERDGPGTYEVGIVLRDEGPPMITATNRLTVTVREVNQAPVLGLKPDQDRATSVLTNGSFELPGLALPPYSQHLVDGDDWSISGWKLTYDGFVNDGTNSFTWLEHRFETPTDVADGDYAVILNPHSALGTSFRAVAGTTYRLTFQARKTGPPDNLPLILPLKVSLGGETREFALDEFARFVELSWLWTATEDDAAAALRFENPSPLGGFKSYALDAVQLVPLVGSGTTVQATAGRLLELGLAAVDFDWPANTLRFDLLTGPNGMALQPTTGLLAWKPMYEQGGRHRVEVKVTDDGQPPLSATVAFDVLVDVPPPLAPRLELTRSAEAGVLLLTIHGEAGRRYRLETSADLGSWAEMQTLTMEADAVVLLLNNEPQLPEVRFYRILVLEAAGP